MNPTYTVFKICCLVNNFKIMTSMFKYVCQQTRGDSKTTNKNELG